VNFGFGDPTAGTLYTFGFECIPAPGGPSPIVAPPTLAGAVLQYALINRYDTANTTLNETQQLYKDGAQGLVASPNPNPTGSPIPLACAGIGNSPSEMMWASAVPGACATIIAPNASVSEGALRPLLPPRQHLPPGGVQHFCRPLGGPTCPTPTC